MNVMDAEVSAMLADATLNSLQNHLPHSLPLDLQVALKVLVDFQKVAYCALKREHTDLQQQAGAAPDLNKHIPDLLLAVRKVWVFLWRQEYLGKPYIAYNLYQALDATFSCVNLCNGCGYITIFDAMLQVDYSAMCSDLQADATVGVPPPVWVADARQYALLVVVESGVLKLLACNQLRSPFKERASDVLAHIGTNDELCRHMVQSLTSQYGWNPTAHGCGELLPPRVMHAMPLNAIKDAVQQAIAAFVNR